MGDVIVLYRPVSAKELALIEASGWNSLPACPSSPFLPSAQ